MQETGDNLSVIKSTNISGSRSANVLWLHKWHTDMCPRPWRGQLCVIHQHWQRWALTWHFAVLFQHNTCCYSNFTVHSDFFLTTHSSLSPFLSLFPSSAVVIILCHTVSLSISINVTSIITINNFIPFPHLSLLSFIVIIIIKCSSDLFSRTPAISIYLRRIKPHCNFNHDYTLNYPCTVRYSCSWVIWSNVERPILPNVWHGKLAIKHASSRMKVQCSSNCTILPVCRCIPVHSNTFLHVLLSSSTTPDYSMYVHHLCILSL